MSVVSVGSGDKLRLMLTVCFILADCFDTTAFG